MKLQRAAVRPDAVTPRASGCAALRSSGSERLTLLRVSQAAINYNTPVFAYGLVERESLCFESVMFAGIEVNVVDTRDVSVHAFLAHSDMLREARAPPRAGRAYRRNNHIIGNTKGSFHEISGTEGLGTAGAVRVRAASDRCRRRMTASPTDSSTGYPSHLQKWCDRNSTQLLL
ncbi:hypothetical protein EVAR_52846_1 [Eumeta japonica]|uniref:Uncharacterized protein n=1 Tax=Eumeta variegata TaxID=151549 RepID=A0A4C1YE52_EUMVA|nr:hypothetical protein EVAR_52846_1 [Eumeta japonica]